VRTVKNHLVQQDIFWTVEQLSSLLERYDVSLMLYFQILDVIMKVNAEYCTRLSGLAHALHC